ncbi:hypothetical protein ACFW4G_20550 [Paenibacillus lactis]|uniref:hypothetical protein n=1 Tax=Paenibacillus TaxID=44249 RepID=UPI0036829288
MEQSGSDLHHLAIGDHSKRIFEALQEGGKIGMPLQETFWSPAYGILTDKYGVTWNISTES